MQKGRRDSISYLAEYKSCHQAIFWWQISASQFRILWSDYKNNIIYSFCGSSGGCSLSRHAILVLLLACKVETPAWAVQFLRLLCPHCLLPLHGHLWGCAVAWALPPVLPSGSADWGHERYWEWLCCSSEGKWIKGEGWTSQASHPAYRSLCSLNCPISHSCEQVPQGGERLGFFNYCNPFDLMHSWVWSLLVKVVLQVDWIRCYFQTKYFGYCSLTIS